VATRDEIAFPNSNDSPTSLAQFARYESITLNISLKLRQPEFSTRFRGVAKPAAGVTMPKTTIDEHGKSLPRKHEIRFPENVSIASPTDYAPAAEKFDQPQFCVAIPARSNTRHYLRPLLCRENVWH
jgi:hypothetical protein